MTEKKLTDLFKLFDSCCEDENSPLPSGVYECEATKGELFDSRNGTPGYKITWQVVGDEYTGRFVWQDLWLTSKAMPHAKRHLKELKITSGGQLKQPLSDGIICKLVVVQRESDNGKQYNEVKKVEFVRQQENPFAYNNNNQPKTDERNEEKWDSNGNWKGTDDEWEVELNEQLKKPTPEDETEEGNK